MAGLKPKIFKLLTDMDEDLKSIKDNLSDIVEIANFQSSEKCVSELLLTSCNVINYKIGKHEIASKMIKDLLNGSETIDTPSCSSEEKLDTLSSQKEKTVDQPPKQEGFKTAHETLSLRPNKGIPISQEKRVKLDISHKGIKIDMQQPAVVEIQYEMMRELYSLSNIDNRYINFSGKYPRINYLQDSSPQEIRKWYDFGTINTIYLTSPDFPEISLLPNWIKEGVRDCYFNNPTISPKDILVLKFLSAGPDFYNDERYPAYHFIQLGKADSFSIQIQNERKEFFKFDANDIHYRRALGIHVILQGMEACFKKGFRTYGGKKIYSSIMITSAKTTPRAAHNFMQAKMKVLEKGLIRSSPQAQARICHIRQHKRDTCPECSTSKRTVENETGVRQDTSEEDN